MWLFQKKPEKKMLSESIADTTAPADVTQVLSLVNLAGRYN